MKKRSRTLFTLCIALPTAALLISGCVGYQLGSMLPGDIRTVHVPVFMNETEEPFLEVETTRAALREIQRDGSLRVATTDEADAVLTVTLLDLRLEALAFDRDRRAAAEEYRLLITAAATLTRRSDNQVVASIPRIEGEGTFIVSGDLTTSKQTAIPRASEDLAKRIIDRLLETWE
jgi:outer membrane lipopolysaccharide assembly protein LptE/RlpB